MTTSVNCMVRYILLIAPCCYSYSKVRVGVVTFSKGRAGTPVYAVKIDGDNTKETLKQHISVSQLRMCCTDRAMMSENSVPSAYHYLHVLSIPQTFW